MWMGNVYVGKLNLKLRFSLIRKMICHCSHCQINSGTAFGYIVGAVNDSFKLLKGEMSFYLKSADSGAKRELTFCR